MANVKTLKPYRKGEERTRMNAAKGGRATALLCAEAKAHGMNLADWKTTRSFTEAAKRIAGMRAQGKAGRAGMTYAEAATLKMWQQAQRGSVKAFHVLALILGEVSTRNEVKIRELPTIVDDVPRFEISINGVSK